MRNCVGRRFYSVFFASVALSIFISFPTSSVAQVRTLAEGVEIQEYTSPFREWIIKPSRSSVGVTTQSESEKKGIDSFERIGPHGKKRDGMAEAPMGYPIGRKKVLIVLADIIARNDDGSTRFIPAPMRSAAEVREFLFGHRTNLNKTLFDASWKQVFLDGDVTGDGDVDVFGPITLTFDTTQATDSKGPAPDYAGGDLSSTGALCVAELTFKNYVSRGVVDKDISPPNLTLTLIDRGAPNYFNCPWYAVTFMNSSAMVSRLEAPSVSDEKKEINRAAIVHEIGHALGLTHSQGSIIHYEGPDESWGDAVKEYGDLECLMGFGPYVGATHYNVPQSYRLGWLPRSSAVDITKAGTYTVTLDNPTKGPNATLPTSIWVERRAIGDTSAPGFIVISPGTGGEMIERLTLVQDTPESRVEERERRSVPFGLTVHGVNKLIDTGAGLRDFYDWPENDDGGSYLLGIVKPNQSFKVLDLGITVKLLKREGDLSVVEVVVKDMHRVITELVEKLVPGTNESLLAMARVPHKAELSTEDIREVKKLYRLFKHHRVYNQNPYYQVLDRNGMRPVSNYEAGAKVQKVFDDIKTAIRKVLNAKGQRRNEFFHSMLKPAALEYMRLSRSGE